MSKKFDKEFLNLDIYKILDLSINAEEKEIKKSFRKKALICHPDKNPDNPDAAKQFNELKKILEILLDPGARNAYDKVLKGKKAAALRAKQSDLKSQKLKSDLERKEKVFQANKGKGPQLSEEERLRREIKRLEEEGEKLIEEEIETLNREAEAQLKRSFNGDTSSAKPTTTKNNCRVKARWISTEDSEGYTEEEIHNLFFKWGEINAIVMKKKGTKHTALIEFKSDTGANFAIQFEKGMIGKPIEVSRSESPEERSQRKKKEVVPPQESEHSRDFESIQSMNRRREAERRKLIEEMMKNDL